MIRTEMLRDFQYNPKVEILAEILVRFNISLSEHVVIVRFEVITPDSFMWRLLMGDGVYYLYAEDYVPGLNHIKLVFDNYLESNDWNLIEPKEIIKFSDAEPVKNASTYTEPEDSGQIMRYAVDSGHDFVFLARSNENANNALFSDSAPRGFILGNQRSA